MGYVVEGVYLNIRVTIPGEPMPKQRERLQTFLVRFGEGKRSLTDGADAFDGVDACH
jgi:hypothetical protein